jgi:hypothetical protein
MHEIKYLRNSFYDNPGFSPLSAFVRSLCKSLKLIPHEEYVRLFAIRSPDWIGAKEWPNAPKTK